MLDGQEDQSHQQSVVWKGQIIVWRILGERTWVNSPWLNREAHERVTSLYLPYSHIGPVLVIFLVVVRERRKNLTEYIRDGIFKIKTLVIYEYNPSWLGSIVAEVSWVIARGMYAYHFVHCVQSRNILKTEMRNQYNFPGPTPVTYFSKVCPISKVSTILQNSAIIWSCIHIHESMGAVSDWNHTSAHLPTNNNLNAFTKIRDYHA